MGKIFSVVSGKGGTGKTTITINLGYSLVNVSKKKVLLFDADLGLNNLDLYLNINIEKNIEKIFTEKAKLQDLVYQKDNIFIISGNTGSFKIANLTEGEINIIIAEIQRMKSKYDYILIDNSPGIHKNVIKFCEISDKIITVTTPEYPSLMDAYQLIKLLINKGYNAPNIGLLINKAEDERDAFSKYSGINSVLKEFIGKEIQFWGWVSKSKLFDKALLNQKIIYEISGHFKKQFDKIIYKL